MAHPVRTPAPAVMAGSTAIITTISGSFAANIYSIRVATNDKNVKAVCENLTARIESLAKMYLGNLRFPQNNNHQNVFSITVACSGGGWTKDIVRITLLCNDFGYVFHHLGAIPKVGATLEDVERVFQTLPNLQEGLEKRAQQQRVNAARR